MQRPWRRALHAALSGLLAGLLAVGPTAVAAQAPMRLVPQTLPAAAAGSPRVLVVAVPLDSAARAHAPHLAVVGARAVAEAGRFEAVDLAQALDAEGTKARTAKAEEGAAAFAEGKRAYDDELDTQKALVQFDRAVRAFEASDLLKHFADLSRARVMKVASQVANGETKAAELEVEKLLGMDPKAQFSPNYFPPEFVTFVEKTRAAVLAEADVSMEVKTEAAPAQVYVDGQFRGVTPAQVGGLTRAEHYVTVLAPGYAVAQERARGGEVDIELTPTKGAPRLQAAMDRISRDADGPGRDAAAVELGTLAGAQQVLVLLARGGSLKTPVEVTAVRLDVADGHNWGYAKGSAPVGDGMEPAAKPLLASVVGVDAPRVGGKPVTHFGSGGPSTGKRTAGYVLMATGAALLAGGVAFGLEASSRADRFNSLAQTDPRAANVRSEGKSFALIADVGMVAGLAAAGVGTWMAFFSGKGSGDSGAKSVAPVEPAPVSRPAEKPVRKELPMPPPPNPTKPAQDLPMPPPPKAREPAPPPASTTRDDRKARDEAARREREAEEQRKAEEARKADEAARRDREAQVQREREESLRREREQEEQRKREEAEKRKREEEKKKKRPTDDDDDLRNY